MKVLLKFLRIRCLCVLLLVFLKMTTGGHAATVIFPTNEVVVLNVPVPQDQVLELSTRHLAPAMGIAFWRITQNGTNYNFRINDSAMAFMGQDSLLSSNRVTLLAGPLTLQLQVSQLVETGLVNYRMLPLTQLQTVIVPARTNSFDPPNSYKISVPPGKQFRVMSLTGTANSMALPGPGYQPPLSVSRPGETEAAQFRQEHWFQADLTGPVDVYVANSGSTEFLPGDDPVVLTYVIFDESVALLPDGVLSVSGGSQPAVLRSSDLQNWDAAALLLNSDGAQSYFQLKAETPASQ